MRIFGSCRLIINRNAGDHGHSFDCVNAESFQ